MYTALHQMGNFRRWAGTNIDATTFASKIPTVTKPQANSTTAVLDLAAEFGGGGFIPTWMKLLFILLGADEDAASFRLIGWNRIRTGQGADNDTLWIPQPFAEFTCIAGAAVGIATAPVLNTERFADTIAPVALKLEDQKIAAGTSLLSDCRIYTPADDTVGHVIIPIRGFELLEMTIDQTVNTPTCNILYSFLR